MNTSLVYFEKNGRYLMLNRNKKQNDENAGKWIGVGGKFEDGESPEDCAKREALEETGLIPNKNALRYRGIVTFVSDIYPCEYMHLFTCNDFIGEIKECDEGELNWVEKDDILTLPLWDGDKRFLKLLFDNAPFFSLKLTYEGEKLVDTEGYCYGNKTGEISSL